MAQPVISFKNTSVTFDAGTTSVEALSSIDLEVEPGQFVCVVGPSGSGKTTLLRLIAGFLQPTAGVVEFEGRPVAGPGWQRGVVFQSASLYPWLDVFRNVAFGPRMRGIPTGERRLIVERYLSMVKLWDSRDRYPHELSGGMRQRVAIARVLANEPHVLLMDEPLGALDALTREHLQEELLEIWRATGKTVVFVTHSVEEAVFLATRIIVLSPRPGRILATIDPPFSRQFSDETGRTIKSDPRFIALREEVLEYIWTSG